ncbi:MAG: TonB-dependent receptor [Crocinitomicaceae bacterium]|nr:TonB-dependent receptor [Crocinitomicaceae bacterium]|tara:strand:- start:107727 stop:110123 length:2397 start_codon:yes stop_codon:yes gene_type:complete
MKTTITLITFLFVFQILSQENSTLSGYLKDISSGEIIIGGKIYIPKLKKGTVTNTYGFYSLTVPRGNYLVEFRSFGMKTTKKNINLTTDVRLDLEIEKNLQNIEEVIVNANAEDNIKSTKLGQLKLDINEIKTLPAFMGEVDVIKTIQLLPGVSSASEGGQGFYVRGGGPDQNLVLLDEAVVYNAAHLFGFFSVFNADAVKNVNLIKGGMPANFGGRMSAVLEVNTNDGNKKKIGVKGGIGAISSRITIEGPLKKNKGSFIVSGRRTYLDLIMKAAIPDSSPFSGSSYYFYDLNLKLDYEVTKKDKIFFTSYYGKDDFSFGNINDNFQVDMPWGNGIASLRWNHIFSSKLFMNLNTTLSDYNFSFGSSQDEFRFSLNSGIRDYGAKIGFTYFPNARHKVKFGADYIYHTFTPVSVSAESGNTTFDTGLAQKLFSHESAIYFLDEFDINENIRLNGGLRYSTFQHVGPFTRYIKGDISTPDSTIDYGKREIIKFYHGLEPRISLRWLLPGKSSIKAGYSYNYQYVHLTSLSAVSLPTDIWYPTTDKAKPQRGWQASIGYFKNFLENRIEASIELYYKTMQNLIEYKEGALPGDNIQDNTDNLLVFGNGWSYGSEFFIKKRVGKFTGWFGYTWSKTERKFEDLNNGEPFPAKYDRRHDLSIVTSYKINNRWTISGSFIYATGNTLTLPTSWYVQNQSLLFNYGQRNSTRMAPYHRLDISATWYGKEYKDKIDIETGKIIKVKKKLRTNVAISIYNIYNRANPYFLYVDNDGDFLAGDFEITVKQVTLFPILPSVTWNFEF